MHRPNNKQIWVHTITRKINCLSLQTPKPMIKLRNIWSKIKRSQNSIMSRSQAKHQSNLNSKMSRRWSQVFSNRSRVILKTIKSTRTYLTLTRKSTIQMIVRPWLRETVPLRSNMNLLTNYKRSPILPISWKMLPKATLKKSKSLKSLFNTMANTLQAILMRHMKPKHNRSPLNTV